ncbi:MAG: FAD synthetase family protein [Mucinivorans sp.]
MRVFKGFDALEAPFAGGAVAAVGSFDGVHRGHRFLFDQMRRLAAQRSMQMVVVTFDPHPRRVTKGSNRLLSTLDEKLILMEHAGVENVVVVHFDEQFMRLTGEEFLRDYLIARLGLRVIFASEGHHFGHDRRSGEDLYPHYKIECVKLARLEGISSTMIRELIEQGRMAQAEELLGEPYLILSPIEDSTKLLPPKTSR